MTIDELPPHAKAILSAARDEYSPTDIDRQRVRRRVTQALAVGASAASIDHASASSSGLARPAANAPTEGAVVDTGRAFKLGGFGSKLLLGAVVIGSAGIALMRHQSTIGHHRVDSAHEKTLTDSALPSDGAAEPPLTVEPAKTPSTTTAPNSGADVPTIAPSVTDARPVARHPAPALPVARRVAHARVADHSSPVPAENHADTQELSQATAPQESVPADVAVPASTHSHELALVRGVVTALRDQNPRKALALLDEHGARFPEGLLAVERQGLRVLALCEAGLMAEANRERVAFLAEHGTSPLGRRVAKSCGAPEHDDSSVR